MSQTKVGVGVLIFKGQQLLLGKRKGSHGAETWSPPGGHLEFCESFEVCAMREVKEETDLSIDLPEFLAVTNDVFEEENKHYVTIFMCAHFPKEQKIKNKEPEKCLLWEWFDINELPDNLFLPLKNLLGDEGVELLLELTEVGKQG
tara:strand:+ start:1534 stop:1971 length:438 start_codon:yes stop_codon:yes gene_type:complete